MFRKRALSGLLILALVAVMMPVLSVSAAPVPYTEINIAAAGPSHILAVHFDSYEYDWAGSGGERQVRPDEDVATEEPGNNLDFDSMGNIGWTNYGSWVQWTVNVEADGHYRFSVWLASAYGDIDRLRLYYNDAQIGYIEDHIEADGWHEYHPYFFGDVEMTAGTHVITLRWDNEDGESTGGFNLAAITAEPLNAYGFPVWAPVEHRVTRMGTTVILATDFDPDSYGKEPADGYHHVREHAINTQGNESEWGSNIGWIGEGDWVQYTVTFAADGVYYFVAAIGAGMDDSGQVRVLVGDIEVGTSAGAPNVGWAEYERVEVGEAEILAGEHIIRIEFPDGGLNFAALEINRTGDIPSDEPEPTEAPAVGDAADDAADANGEEAGENGEEADTTSETDDDDDSIVLWIIIGVAAVVVIAVIIILIAKKKKS